MYAYFVFKSEQTRKHVPRKTKSFFIKNMCAGSIYFLVFPALYLLTGFAHPYLRHRWFTFANYGAQIYASLFLL